MIAAENIDDRIAIITTERDEFGEPILQARMIDIKQATELLNQLIDAKRQQPSLIKSVNFGE